ncbi:YggS family pyridoxal phosphate-dependent enzyme [Prosthecochloris sp.]|uniref:YggS family pyridoxal phosphate-dependent enzyme n=1 Tax=Prosthecochloris sp. TaxID=290513 RepID=UPI0025F57A64|nr:YggS family pyridoxal phosphate-dependent enzyme [Prosthecochloris sp.]
MNNIAHNLEQIHEEIRSACKKSGRNPSAIRLIAVSKTKPAALIKEAYDAGQLDIGESYVQEFIAKESSDQLSELPLHWHFIGHLQSNKVKEIVGKVSLVHSIDRLGTAEELSKRATRKNVIVDYLVEINTSGEVSKFGLPPAELLPEAAHFFNLPNIRLRGLMTIASPDRKKARHEFRMLADLLEQLRRTSPEPDLLTELSMGMSQDYDIAIEEGATMIRIGTAIFGSRQR